MLSKMVKNVIAKNPEFLGLENVIEKEILHHDIMTVLHQEGLLQKLTFMGGTSMRLCYDSSRLSEDLDFTGGENFKIDSFAGLDVELKTFLENKYGLNVSVYEPQDLDKNTSTWKVTIEKHANRPDIPSQKMHIDVSSIPSLDVQHRPLIDHYGIDSQLIGLPIPVESLEELLADKMIAFAYRKRRIKPRDVWDIVWLKQQRVSQNFDFVLQKLAVRNKNLSEFKELLRKHLDLLNNDIETKNDFYQEMSRFLPQSVAANTIEQKSFWPYVYQSTAEEVDSLFLQLEGNANQPEFKM